jgi:surface antigen
MRNSSSRFPLGSLLSLVLAAVCTTAVADPPDHAPAHGWRKKHDREYVGYAGGRWENDYSVSTGHCNREEIGAVLGGVAGGIVGSKVSSPENRVVGTIIGAAAGALIGSRIGRELDEGDRGCFGHALELARPGDSVEWVNRSTGVTYLIVPGEGRREKAGLCRTFTLEAAGRGNREKRTGRACQESRGVWKIV